MIGTIINIVAILVGSGLGMFFGSKVPERIRTTVVAGLGLFTMVIGFNMAIQTQNSIIVLGSLLIGALLGEWWKLEDGLQNLGVWLEARLLKNGTQGKDSRFVRGFVTSSLLFCIGPMAILGSIQDGLVGDYSLLAIKSIMDGFAALAFSSTLGIGVAFSILPTLVYQGGISLLAGQAQAFITTPMMTEMTAVGGVVLVGLAISSLLEIRRIRIGSFLPAIFVAPLIVAVLAALGINAF